MELEAYIEDLRERVMTMEKESEKLDKKVNIKHDKVEPPMVSFLALEAERERGIYERKELVEHFEKEKESIRTHYKSLIKWITIPLSIILALIVSGIIWFFANYDIITYQQAISEVQGDATIEDGIHYND